MKKLGILAIAIFISLSSFGQSKTVAEFEENTDGYKAFLYQSVIRVMNKDKNPDFNMLIRDLDHLKFVSTDKNAPDGKATFLKLDQGVKGEGYEEIMSFDNPDNICHVYELKSSGGQSTWVATFLTEGVAGAFEMKGSLDLTYIKALSSLNMDRLQEVLPIDPMEKKKE
ncbi:MAG: DUF4252 domain-containing protein [Bacteroidota bacterium]